MVGRPLPSGEDFGTPCSSVSCGELDSLDAAVASCDCAGEDNRPPVAPVVAETFKLAVSCDAGDADSCGSFSNSAVNC